MYFSIFFITCIPNYTSTYAYQTGVYVNIFIYVTVPVLLPIEKCEFKYSQSCSLLVGFFKFSDVVQQFVTNQIIPIFKDNFKLYQASFIMDSVKDGGRETG